MLFFGFLKIRFCASRNKRDGIALASIVRNEAPYLAEFIEYYRLIGFSKIIIYDNNSTDNIESVLNQYISSGFVKYYKMYGLFGAGRQKDVYNDAMNKYGHKYKYMCFFDIDEFLRIDGFDSFKEVNDEFLKHKDKNIGGLGVNMFLFGTSGNKTKPSGLVIENYYLRKEKNYHANHHTKCIVDSEKVLCMHNSHTPFLFKKYSFLLCDGQICSWTKTNLVDDSHLILYHYYTRSEEEYYDKMSKGDVLLRRNKKGDLRVLHPLSELDSDNIEDKYMYKYLPKIKKAIYK